MVHNNMISKELKTAKATLTYNLTLLPKSNYLNINNYNISCVSSFRWHKFAFSIDQINPITKLFTRRREKKRRNGQILSLRYIVIF